MKKHTKIYFDYFGYGIDDIILCEICGKIAVDIHHVYPKGMGGSNNKNNIENLVAVYRDCHIKAHENKLSKAYIIEIHKQNLK